MGRIRKNETHLMAQLCKIKHGYRDARRKTDIPHHEEPHGARPQPCPPDILDLRIQSEDVVVNQYDCLQMSVGGAGWEHSSAPSPVMMKDRYIRLEGVHSEHLTGARTRSN
jgi:hypothetical protein